MADLRIRVGASLDASVEAVFPAIERAAQRARRTVEREFATAVPKAMKTGADKAESEFAKLAAEVMPGAVTVVLTVPSVSWLAAVLIAPTPIAVEPE